MLLNRWVNAFRNPLFLVAVISTIFTLFLLEKQLFIGVPYYDVFVYLNNALIYAGIPVGNLSVIYLSPLMPFLSSLVFRTGFISEGVLFLLDGVLFIIGAVGLYLLFKERFNTPASFAGVLIYLSYPLTMVWSVSGGIDFPGVSLSLLVIYVLVLGVNKDSKLLYLVFPLFVLAFLAKYTSAILIFPLLFYLLINGNSQRNVKNIMMGVLAGLAVLTPFLFYVLYELGNLYSFLNIFTSTLFGSGATVNDLGYNPVKLYFLNNLLNYISVGPLTGIYGIIQSPSRGYPSILSYLIAFLVTIGLVLYICPGLKNKLKISSISRATLLKVLLLLVFVVSGVYSFFSDSYIVAELIFMAVLYLTYNLLGDEGKNFKLDLLFLSWLGAFFIFHSIIPVKEDRYFITMLPALTYFIILGLNSFIDKLGPKLKNGRVKTIFLVGIGLLFLSFSSATLIGHVTQEGYGFYVQSACNWLKEDDPHYLDKVIYSNYDPAATWALKKEVKFGVPRLYVNLDAFSDYLKGNGADYYIDAYSTNPFIPGYHIIFSNETVTIYQNDY
ncbi:MAG TPA: glycosyltransferase family 39 protein [Methanobacterium sp.]|nr:glycosyltransferase family 39 protein [Methanobacterium sp.]